MERISGQPLSILSHAGNQEFLDVMRWNKEKADSHQESNPGHLACVASAELQQPDNHQPS